MWQVRRNIEEQIFGFYNYAMGLNYIEKVKQCKTQLSKHYQDSFKIDLEHSLRRSLSLVDYDTSVTSITFGYSTLDDYYFRSSAIHKIPNIKVPTMFISSKNDPVLGKGVIDIETLSENPNILYGITERGGHLAYFEKFGCFK